MCPTQLKNLKHWPRPSELDKLDVDLTDKIKNATTRMKTTQQRKRKSKFKTAKFLCSICEKNCNNNQDAIVCTHCESWVHRKCNATSKQEYERLSSEADDAPFQCLLCIMKENSQIFPFYFLDKSDILQLNDIDLPSQLELLGSYELKSRLAKLPNLQDFDMDENLIHAVNSKYYDVSTFPQIKKMTKKSFSLFHSNLRSLSAHFDELQLLLTALKSQFDVIGISETCEQSKGFLTNVNLDGYILHSQPSKSSAGGVALYVKSNLDHFVRDDLSSLEDEFETLWIEIKNTKDKNILCCCAYRHPNTDVKKFNDHIDQIMQNISKENKLLFLMGDFNVSLLNYESDIDTNDFINTMISHYLLPYILHPTQVTDHSETVIDNIFSNNTSHEIISGNIISQISDHFPQFTILNHVTINYKTCSYAKCDLSNSDEQKFINGLAGLDTDFLQDTNHSLNSKFGIFFQTVSDYVDKHALLKTMNKKDLKLQSKPWINSKIL